jgi:hypothetical protein
MSRFFLQNIFIKVYIFQFSINIFIKIRSQSYVVDRVAVLNVSFYGMKGVCSSHPPHLCPLASSPTGLHSTIENCPTLPGQLDHKGQ